MTIKNHLEKAWRIVGKVKMAGELNISHQSMTRWHQVDEMPCTEYNGKTFYSLRIQELTDGEVTITDLLGFVPHPQQAALDARK